MGKDASEIRREIAQTRMRMDDTVAALAYKVDLPSRVKDAVNDRVETAKGTIGDVVDTVKDAVTGAGVRVGSTIDATRRTMSETLSETTDRMGNVGHAARRGFGIAVENPLGLALGALALGILGGLLLPVSEFEREKIGPLRDELLDRAKTMGREAVERAL